MHIIFATALLMFQSLFGGLPISGIHCDSMEGAVEHIHAHLQIFDHGKLVGVPAQVGISENGSCLYWVHTHTADGIIHIESPVKRTFTLGQFFDIWEMDLSRTTAASVHASAGRPLTVTVNGKPWMGDPRLVPLRDHEEIVIQNGTPVGRPVATDWSKL